MWGRFAVTLGTLDIDRQNMGRRTETPVYWVTFTPYVGASCGSQPREEIVGDEPLFERLLNMQPATLPLAWRTQRVREWMSEIQSTGHLLLEDFRISEEEWKVLQPHSDKIVTFRRNHP
jgi:hypothetical protein